MNYNKLRGKIREVYRTQDEFAEAMQMNALLSDLSGIPADEIPEMPFGTTPSMIWDVVNDAKNANFFGELSKLL